MEPWRREKQFWANVLEGDADECWPWHGARNKAGYGVWGRSRRTGEPARLAHRIAYEYAVGSIPDGDHIHHRCKNTRCCNPSHLELQSPTAHAELHFAERIKTLCSRGHPITEQHGERRCLVCRAQYVALREKRRQQDPEYAEAVRKRKREWAARKRAEDPDFAERERTAARNYQRRKRAEREDA